MFLNADVVVKVVMVGLAFASLVTWTVWLAKSIELRVARKVAHRRLKMLEGGGSLLDAVRGLQGGSGRRRAADPVHGAGSGAV